LPVIYVFTHDSVFLGEDGPTHQAVEHLAALRAIPNLTVIRPGDAAETAQAWAAALRNRHGPTALILSRQSLPTLDRSVCAPAAGLQQGAYTLWQNRDGAPDLIILATGSEVAPALKAAQSMEKESAAIRVVSFPSWELFDSQPNDLKEKILPAACAKRLVVEAGVSHGWQKYAGSAGAMVCLNRFGASAPAEVLAEKFGFTAEHIAQTARQLLA
ncbi:MAG TPA: transketolase C-terminal domain-containing protein, partial [Kiritimatiellia bacterium]|nr:transketolase C-terminal domain-containing protein [Kiritimatiellia bacterium]